MVDKYLFKVLILQKNFIDQMYELKQSKISNGQRMQKREKRKNDVINHLTPEKYINRQSTIRTVGRLQKKFGYDYEIQDSKPLKQIKQEFLHKTVEYLGKRQWPKKLGRKQKYEKNIQLGKPLKQNPFLKIFNRIQNKLFKPDQVWAFEVMKIKLKQSK